MIIVRTPMRVSLFGGGTDFKEFYEVTDGEVVSFTIDKSMYVTVSKKFDGKLHLRYSKTEIGQIPEDLKHDIVRECLKYVGIKSGIEIVTISDVPSIGTGLGSSGALTVGLLKALFTYVGKSVTSEELAEAACEIELVKLGAHIGKQDQYASACGGFNHFIFTKNGTVIRKLLSDSLIGSISENIRLFYVPNGRKSSSILKIYKSEIKNNIELLKSHKALVTTFLAKSIIGELTISSLGDLLNKCWELKKSTYPASNEIVDKATNIALRNGGIGAKNCGAGQGGFLLVVTESNGGDLDKIMEKEGFKKLSFKYFPRGSEVIYKSNE